MITTLHTSCEVLALGCYLGAFFLLLYGTQISQAFLSVSQSEYVALTLSRFG